MKAKIAFEAAKGKKTISQLASDYGVYPKIGQWKKKVLEELSVIFLDKRVCRDKEISAGYFTKYNPFFCLDNGGIVCNDKKTLKI